MVAAYTSAGFWGKETIYRLAAWQARSAPGAFAVRDRHRRLTYAALVEAADRLAASLAGGGIGPAARHCIATIPSAKSLPWSTACAQRP